MSYRQLSTNELVCTPADTTDLYIIASGKIRFSRYKPDEVLKEELDLSNQKIDMISHKLESQTLGPGEIFGSFSCLGGEPWTKLFAYALDAEAELLAIDGQKLQEMYERVVQSKLSAEYMEFLDRSIPGFKNRLTSNKFKMAEHFTARNFKPGAIISKQGEPLDQAFVI